MIKYNKLSPCLFFILIIENPIALNPHTLERVPKETNKPG